MRTTPVLWLALGLAGLSCTEPGSKPSSKLQPESSAAASTPSASGAPHGSAALGAASAGAPGDPTPDPATYNVVLIYVDSLRADMPWSGYPRDIAPNLTRLAKSSVWYSNAYSLSSYTAKSIPPSLIGAYPSELKRDGYFFTKWPEENLFLAERAQAAGHRTLAGHVHGYFLPKLGMGPSQGVDDYRMIEGPIDLQSVKSITDERLTKLAKQQLSDPANVKLADDKRFFAVFHYLDPHHTYERHAEHSSFGNKPRDLYDGEVHWTDHWVGELLNFIDAQPWAKQTAVIITADHGEGFGEKNQFRHAYELWESLVRVPWLFRIPGVTPRRIDVPRSHIDLAPTIAALMGIAAEPAFRGQALVPELMGKTEPPRPVIVDLPRDDLQDRRRAIIDSGYKLISFGDDKRFQLYHLKEDPEEKQELSAEQPEVLARMKALLEAESAKIPATPVIGGAALKGAAPGKRF